MVMDLSFSAEDERFRDEIRSWLHEALSGEFAELRGRGGPGDEEHCFDGLMAWERKRAADGWLGIAWPREHGGRGATLMQQVIFNEEYARARAPGRLSHIGEELAGPTILAFGTAEQKAKFLPGIMGATEFWAQGYSEPNAGSDLANVQTRAVRDGDDWVIEGQKTWTSGAHWSDWCFVLARTQPDAPKHKGISYILVPMKQPGVRVHPIRQMTGSSEFNEVFFDGARAPVAYTVGGDGGGWKVAMGTLAFERGASTLGQQLAFAGELEQIIALAKQNGAASDPGIRQRIADAWMGLRLMRITALRVLSGGEDGTLSREALISKLYWATWHRKLGELAMDIAGPDGLYTQGDAYDLHPWQRVFLFSRSDTIYAGTNQIQRNIIAERALGLPRGDRA
jgi:alkylation response protein AidB-like acyl-CoA dehydrogenase